MKKLIAVLGLMVMGAASAQSEYVWSWWKGAPSENTTKDVTGCALGIASETASITGAQVSLVFNMTDEVKAGAQVALGFNTTESLKSGAQVSLFYNEAKTVKNGPQVALVNVADAAALQFGLLCFNKDGFLPFFPFFNFSTNQFGGDEK